MNLHLVLSKRTYIQLKKNRYFATAMLGVLPVPLSSHHVNELNGSKHWYDLDIKSIIVAISVAPIYPQTQEYILFSVSSRSSLISERWKIRSNSSISLMNIWINITNSEFGFFKDYFFYFFYGGGRLKVYYLEESTSIWVPDKFILIFR